MSHAEHTHLMHAVLDGAATPGEALQLEQLLAANPAARAEFDDLRHVFDALKELPKATPPEGLVSAVMARLPQRPTRLGGIRQLFTKSRVLGIVSIDAPGANPGKSATVHPIMQRGPHHEGEKNMSEQTNSSMGNRKIWIGVGIAAAAVIVVVSTGILPPTGKDTAGTIAPAQRYQGQQGTAADVNLGNPSGTQSSAVAPAVQDASQNAASQNAASQNAASQNAASQNAAAQNAAAQNAAAQNAAAQNAAAQNAAAQNAASQNAGAKK